MSFNATNSKAKATVQYSVQDSSDESVAIAMMSIHVIHRLALTNL